MFISTLLEKIINLSLLKSCEFVFFSEKVLSLKTIENKKITEITDNNHKVSNSLVESKIDEKTSYQLFLTEKIVDQSNKIKAIKIIRDIAGIELRAAKELLDKAPITIKNDLTKTEAEILLKKFENIEAKFEIR